MKLGSEITLILETEIIYYRELLCWKPKQPMVRWVTQNSAATGSCTAQSWMKQGKKWGPRAQFQDYLLELRWVCSARTEIKRRCDHLWTPHRRLTDSRETTWLLHFLLPIFQPPIFHQCLPGGQTSKNPGTWMFRKRLWGGQEEERHKIVEWKMKDWQEKGMISSRLRKIIRLYSFIWYMV